MRLPRLGEVRIDVRRFTPVILRTVWNHVMKDDCLDLAAQMSFYFVTSLFPFLVVIGAVVGWLPSTGLWTEMAPSSPITLRAAVAGLRLSSVQSLENASYPVSGTVSADVSVQGTKQSPSGHGWIRIANGSAWRQPVTLATVNFHGDASALHAVLEIETPAGPPAGIWFTNSLPSTIRRK